MKPATTSAPHPGTIRRERQERFAATDLYVVTCAPLSNGRSNYDVLDALIAGGGRIIQLREKGLDVHALYDMAVRFRDITRAADVLLIINDHLDIALAVDADGVHLGQDDFPLAAARRIAPNLLLGSSSHSLDEALKADADGADYVNIGPIFPTGTKEHVRPVGTEAIRVIAPRLHVPFTVMGGIKESNIADVVAAGARHVAVVTAVTQAVDMAAAVRTLRGRIGSPPVEPIDIGKLFDDNARVANAEGKRLFDLVQRTISVQFLGGKGLRNAGNEHQDIVQDVTMALFRLLQSRHASNDPPHDINNFIVGTARHMAERKCGKLRSAHTKTSDMSPEDAAVSKKKVVSDQ